MAPLSLALVATRAIGQASRRQGSLSLIDAHYFYPDGVAAVVAAKRLGVPVVITARGTDINLIPSYAVPRRMIQWAASEATAIIAVCKALKDRMVDLGVDPHKVHVLRNGVDTQLFRPQDRFLARGRLGLGTDGKLLLSVGHLIERKGHDIVIRSLPDLPDADLLIVGKGEEEGRLRGLAAELGVASRVHFVGEVTQEDLCWYYSACDVLVLASSREGWANVLLESMACGTPVIATGVWGTPEVVAVREAGVLMRERTAGALVEAYGELMAAYPRREDTRRYAERHDWEATTQGQLELFRSIAARTERSAEAATPREPRQGA